MKRIIVLLTLLLSFGLIQAADQCNILVNGSAPGDSLRYGVASTFDIQYANDALLGGMTTGFIFFSPDGATLDWNNVGGLDPTNGMLTVVAGSRMTPPGDVWDLGGFLITEEDLDGNLPDSILFGGAALSGGLPPGPLETMVQMHFIPGTTGDPEVPTTLCIDSSYIPPAGDFVFNSTAPECLWPVGGLCLPVAKAVNFCPTIDNATGDANVDHCGSVEWNFTASDLDGDAIAYEILSNSGNGAAVLDDAGDGTAKVTYTATTGDMGSAIAIEVAVYDAIHGPGGCADGAFTINLTATNNAPTIDCGKALEKIGINNPLTKSDITAGDVDGCDGLTFALVSGPGAVDPSTGEYTWTPGTADGDQTFPITVSVTDGYETTECTFNVEVLTIEPYSVWVKKMHDVLQGTYVTVPVEVFKGSEAMGGFDFLLAYDNTALTFTGAELGSAYENCGWEYFTYRYGVHGNCGNGCPSGEIRLVGIAETNNGPVHPDFDCINLAKGNPLVNLTFFVTTDVNFNDMFAQVDFVWYDCGDNTISVASGDTLAIADEVFYYYGVNDNDDFDEDNYLPYPSTLDMPSMTGAPAECDVYTDKGAPVRFITFYQGGVDIIDKDDIDARGDINYNGLANEIADAVMFTNYFIIGDAAFVGHVPGSTAASDVNADGTPLTLADLVYLVRVIQGDALPYPKPAPGALFTAVLQGDHLTVNTTEDAGAALFTFNIDGTANPTINSDMDIISNIEGNELRVLVYNIGSEALTDGTVLDLNVDGSVELTGVEAATYNGAEMQTTTRVLPTAFSAMQNYPNPFNPTTTIGFNLSVASNWTVDIYNIAGQKVNSFNGFSQPGTVNVTWDATDANGSSVASGIYFYKISAGANSATMKMILMK